MEDDEIVALEVRCWLERLFFVLNGHFGYFEKEVAGKPKIAPDVLI